MQKGIAFKKYVNNLFRDTIISIIFFTIIPRYHDVIDTNKICVSFSHLSKNDINYRNLQCQHFYLFIYVFFMSFAMLELGVQYNIQR